MRNVSTIVLATCFLSAAEFNAISPVNAQDETGAQDKAVIIPKTPTQSAKDIYGKFKGARFENPAALKKALAEVNNENFNLGYKMLSDLGDSGSADALFHMGEIDRLGILKSGVNLNSAIDNYRVSASLGHLRAGLSLANMLYFDKGIDKKGLIKNKSSVQSAIAAWQQLAMEDNPEALYMLGMLYWNGDASLNQDPIRGYGLIYRAANKGYRDAIRAEASMLPDLSFDAREAGRDYGLELQKYGFTEDVLRIDLVMENIMPASFGKRRRKKPPSWELAWHLELGIALYEKDAKALVKQIEKEYRDIAGLLHYEIVPSPIRPTRFQLVMGPMKDMTETVRYCIKFKKNGIDCFATAPNN